jgi:hypothetical protein
MTISNAIEHAPMAHSMCHRQFQKNIFHRVPAHPMSSTLEKYSKSLQKLYHLPFSPIAIYVLDPRNKPLDCLMS